MQLVYEARENRCPIRESSRKTLFLRAQFHEDLRYLRSKYVISTPACNNKYYWSDNEYVLVLRHVLLYLQYWECFCKQRKLNCLYEARDVGRLFKIEFAACVGVHKVPSPNCWSRVFRVCCIGIVASVWEHLAFQLGIVVK